MAAFRDDESTLKLAKPASDRSDGRLASVRGISACVTIAMQASSTHAQRLAKNMLVMIQLISVNG